MPRDTQKPPRSVTVFVDTREQYPLLFPQTVRYYPYRSGVTSYLIHVNVEPRKLATGDYALAGATDRALIERKGALGELAKNFLTRDHKRACAALDRLVEACTHPYLMLEETPAGLFPSVPPRWATAKSPSPDCVVDAFLREVISRRIQLLFVGRTHGVAHRRKLGHFILKILLAHGLPKDTPNPRESILTEHAG